MHRERAIPVGRTCPVQQDLRFAVHDLEYDIAYVCTHTHTHVLYYFLANKRKQKLLYIDAWGAAHAFIQPTSGWFIEYTKNTVHIVYVRWANRVDVYPRAGKNYSALHCTPSELYLSAWCYTLTIFHSRHEIDSQLEHWIYKRFKYTKIFITVLWI